MKPTPSGSKPGIFLITLLLLTAGTAWAKSPIQKNWRGLAVKGYDVVAYFKLDKPVKGDKAFQYEWMDATWRFASKAHLEAFKADPHSYAPQYGGYWAWAVAMGTTAKIDPVNGWKIVDGKLYLNYNSEIQAKWLKDIPGFIEKANRNWPGVLK